jgi:hypothetical protein
MEIHHEARHPKLPFEPAKCVRDRGCVACCADTRGRRCENVHEAHGGVTTQGVAVRGSVKKIVH